MNASAEKEVILSSRDKGCGGRIDSVWRDRLGRGISLLVASSGFVWLGALRLVLVLVGLVEIAIADAVDCSRNELICPFGCSKWL